MFPNGFFTNNSPSYQFHMMVTFTAKKKGGGTEQTSFSTEINRFGIMGGSERSFRPNGEGGLGDADLMSEFYQAKHFHNLVVTKQVNSSSPIFQRIYDGQLSFSFTFTVRSLDSQSRFRSLRLVARNAHITKPPTSSGDGVTLNIKYSNPEVFHGYAQGF